MPAVPRRHIAKIGMLCGAAGAHAGMWLAAPVLATICMMLEVALTATVVLTALFAPEPISDRAFRMLPWTKPSNRGSRPA